MKFGPPKYLQFNNVADSNIGHARQVPTPGRLDKVAALIKRMLSSRLNMTRKCLINPGETVEMPAR